MDEITNMNDVPDGQFIDNAGTHNVVIREIKPYTSPEKGTPGKVLVLQDEHGRTMRHTYWLTPGSMPFVKMLARACGLTEQQMGAFTWNMILGKSLQIVTEADGSYQKVVKVNSATVEVMPVDLPARPPVNEDVPF
jgi:hypothetical protein